MVLQVLRCAAWDTLHFTQSRRNGAPACRISIICDRRKIREPAGSRSAQKPVLEFSYAEALLGYWWIKVIICARAVKTTCQAVA